MAGAAIGDGPDNGSGSGDASGRSPTVDVAMPVAAPAPDASDAEVIQLPTWTKSWAGAEQLGSSIC
jgi:hypothetical protein